MRDRLFQPIEVGGVTAKNRIVMAPMVTNYATDEDEVTERQVSYYAERARGGVGTIVVEASPVSREARISSRQIGSYENRFLPGMALLAGAIRSAGAIAILQLCHGGPKMCPRPGLPTESISSIPVRAVDTPRPLSKEDLRQIRGQFVASAGRAREAGFDGVELHAAHLYLLSASLTPFTNQRTDEYGGSTENRVRLTREVLEEIKAAVGDESPGLGSDARGGGARSRVERVRVPGDSRKARRRPGPMPFTSPPTRYRSTRRSRG